MVRNSPCELFIKYLVVHPNKYDNDTIEKYVRDKQLDYPGEEYLEKLRKKLRVPLPFYPFQAHEKSRRFIMKERLDGFFQPDDVSEAAHQLLENPKAKEMIETLAMAKDPPELIAFRLGRLGVRVDGDVVQRYCQFYWNLAKVDRTELEALMRLRVEHMQYRKDGQPMTNDQKMQYAALKKSAYKDGRRIIAEMANQPAAAIVNAVMHGYSPTQWEVSKLLHTVMMSAVTSVLEETTSRGPGASSNALNYALAAEKAYNLMSEMGSPDAELQKSLQQLALRTEEAAVPHIGELQGSFESQLEPVTRENIDAK